MLENFPKDDKTRPFWRSPLCSPGHCCTAPISISNRGTTAHYLYHPSFCSISTMGLRLQLLLWVQPRTAAEPMVAHNWSIRDPFHYSAVEAHFALPFVKLKEGGFIKGDLIRCFVPAWSSLHLHYAGVIAFLEGRKTILWKWRLHWFTNEKGNTPLTTPLLSLLVTRSHIQPQTWKTLIVYVPLACLFLNLSCLHIYSLALDGNHSTKVHTGLQCSHTVGELFVSLEHTKTFW